MPLRSTSPTEKYFAKEKKITDYVVEIGQSITYKKEKYM